MTQADAGKTDGWEQHRLDQLRRTSQATPLQRLRWLEDAIAFAFRAGALSPPAPPEPDQAPPPRDS